MAVHSLIIFLKIINTLTLNSLFLIQFFYFLLKFTIRSNLKKKYNPYKIRNEKLKHIPNAVVDTPLEIKIPTVPYYTLLSFQLWTNFIAC